MSKNKTRVAAEPAPPAAEPAATPAPAIAAEGPAEAPKADPAVGSGDPEYAEILKGLALDSIRRGLYGRVRADIRADLYRRDPGALPATVEMAVAMAFADDPEDSRG